MEITGTTAILGGSFNPPHISHQMACLYLLEALAADGVLLVPACHHPFGKSLVSFEHREAMCEILARPFGGRVELSDVECGSAAAADVFALACVDAVAHATSSGAALTYTDLCPTARRS